MWTQAKIQQYVDDEIQESLTLEYKAADALGKSDGKKTEITKDVSAMANSSGGIIVYGIKEYDTPDKRHLPEKIDPVEQDKYSKEWLEQIVNNIRPRLDGAIVHPVPLSSGLNHVAYVVEIPQSNTAHQAADHRYYKRFNFQSVPMEDYEVRDTMGRGQHPKIELAFKIEKTIDKKQRTGRHCEIKAIATNAGSMYAQYVITFIRVPIPLLHELTIEQINYRHEEILEENGQQYYEYSKQNTVRDVVDSEVITLGGAINKYGPARYVPILPGLSRTWGIGLRDDFDQVSLDGLIIKWTIYADNAPPNHGEIKVGDITVIDH